MGGDMNDEEVEEDVVVEEDLVEEGVEEEWAKLEPTRSKGRKKKKRVANGEPAEPRIKSMVKGGKYLAKERKVVIKNPITGMNQNTNTIESCEKWAEVRLAVAKAKDDMYNPDSPVSGAAEGQPDGNENAKKSRDSRPSSELLQASIEQCITDAKIHSAMREEKSEARWSTLMTKEDAKLDLLRTNKAVEKGNTDVAF
ncbi:putative methionyl-tRNA synthetase [Hordeum vulgare]|nr:putative methionyl-tRNA synthetase [Hordeum vulgare]